MNSIINNEHPGQTLDAWPADNDVNIDPFKDLQVEGWLDSLDARTRETTEHIFRVTEAVIELAKLAKVPGNEMVHIRYGALLHDIGNIGIPDAILLKSGQLTFEEWEIVRQHPVYAHDLLYPVEHLRDSLSIPFSHHEKWDGTGYPRRLKGEQIPLSARLFAVVDVWDKLSHDRVYGKAWPREKIIAYLQGQSGCSFDPEVVDLFLRAQLETIKYQHDDA